MSILRTFLLLAMAAAILGLVVPVPSFDRYVAGVETRRLQNNGKCPLSAEVLENTKPEVIVLCANYGLLAYLDAEQDQASAERVYTLVGQTAEFHAMRNIYGFKVVAVINHYYTEGSAAAQLSNAVGTVVADLWEQLKTDPMNLTMPAAPEELKPEELAIYALLNIKEHGEVFLAQFELLPDNTVVRKPIESAAQNAYEILMGGVRNLEQKVVLGEHLTPYDYGGAALDVAIVFAGAKLLTKPVAAAGKAGKFATVTARAVKALTVGAKIGAVGAAGVAAYVAITDPLQMLTGITSAGGWIAEQVGLPAWVGQAAGWFMILFVLWPIAKLVYKLLGVGAKLLPRPNTRRRYRTA